MPQVLQTPPHIFYHFPSFFLLPRLGRVNRQLCGNVCFPYTFVATFSAVIGTFLLKTGPVHPRANHRDKQANGKHTMLIKKTKKNPSTFGASSLPVRWAKDSVVPLKC